MRLFLLILLPMVAVFSAPIPSEIEHSVNQSTNSSATRISTNQENIEKFETDVAAKFDKLAPTVQTLFKKIGDMILDIRQKYNNGEKVDIEEVNKTLKGLIGEYMALSEEAKATIFTQFPFIAKLAKDEKMRQYFEMVMQ